MDIRNNENAHQFETNIDGHTALAAYDLEPNRIVLTHTKVPPELGGRGIANELAKTALGYAREHGLKVVPQCSFMAKFIERNPEYQDLLA